MVPVRVYFDGEEEKCEQLPAIPPARLKEGGDSIVRVQI